MSPGFLAVTGVLSSAAGAGLDRLDAQLLLLHALGKPASDRAWLLAHDRDAVPDLAHDAFMALAQRRLRGEPVAYLTGNKEFFGLDLRVDARVLVPRPDTETLVEWALEILDRWARSAPDERVHRVLDLGTGSGAVALAIKHSRPRLQVSATDFSADALVVAKANAQRLQLDVSFNQGSWLEALSDTGDADGANDANDANDANEVTGRYDVIVSNPPYIAAHDPHLAALAYEPLQALASGADGLDDIRTIIGQAPGHLCQGGWLLLEHGYDQAASVRALLHNAGFQDVQSRRDLSGIERCSGGFRAAG
jgi:release factor glutamine methyltransferase